jgi:hypothetical protein
MKTKKYWLRGMIAGGIISLIIFILLRYLSEIPGSFFDNLYIVVFFPVYVCLVIFYGVGNYINLLVHILLVVLQGLILGTVVGWIYGKVKNRQSGKQKGSVSIWIIVLLVIVIIIGGIYWYSTQNSNQSAVSSGTQTQQTRGTVNTSQTKPIQNSTVSVTIDQASLTSKAKFPTITGTATNISSLAVVIDGYLPAKDNTLAMYTGTVKVINGKWSFTPSAANSAFGGPQGLWVGTYTVIVGQTEASSLATGTLTITN